MNDLQKVAADLDLCDLGLGVTRGKLRKRFAAHKAACLAEIARIDPLPADIAALSDDDLLAALGL